MSAPAIVYPSAVPFLRRDGYFPLPGLCEFSGTKLAHPISSESWTLLADPHIQTVIRDHGSAGTERYTFDDAGRILQCTGFSFVEKPAKSYVTLVGDTAEELAVSHRLPPCLNHFFAWAADFLKFVSSTVNDVLPPASLPVVPSIRVFNYHPTAHVPGMRSHFDGSRITVIVAASDGMLFLRSQGKWRVARRKNDLPFAIMLPGIALGDQRIAPTAHRVAPINNNRSSLTYFQSPDLGRTEEEAKVAALRWGKYIWKSPPQEHDRHRSRRHR